MPHNVCCIYDSAQDRAATNRKGAPPTRQRARLTLQMFAVEEGERRRHGSIRDVSGVLLACNGLRPAPITAAAVSRGPAQQREPPAPQRP
jgi:hypothetical protein